MLLGRVEPFQALDERARLTVVEHGTRRTVDKGQMVFWQDDPGEAMFVLLEGSVKLIVCSRDGELIELHRHVAPASFGELAVLDGGPRSASAIRPIDLASWKLSPSSTTAAGCRASISASSRSSVARLS